MTEGWTPPGVPADQLAKLAACADHYAKHYDIAFKRLLASGGRKETLGAKPCPCRFCGRSAPEVKFGNIAHAVPEFAGNGVLVTTYECDECNDRFSAFEDDLGKMTLLYRVVGQVIGKGGVPSIKSPQKLSRIDMEPFGLRISDFEADPIVEIDQVAKSLTLKVRSQPYRTLGAYKALVKMALSVMDEADLASVPEALRWLRANDVVTDRIDDGVKHACIRTFAPGPRPFPGLAVLLLRRKSSFQNGPGLIFVMAYGNLSFQIVVPSPALDRGLIGRTVNLLTVPVYPFMEPNNVKGKIKSWTEHFDDPSPIKEEQTATLSFHAMETGTNDPTAKA